MWHNEGDQRKKRSPCGSHLWLCDKSPQTLALRIKTYGLTVGVGQESQGLGGAALGSGAVLRLQPPWCVSFCPLKVSLQEDALASPLQGLLAGISPSPWQPCHKTGVCRTRQMVSPQSVSRRKQETIIETETTFFGNLVLGVTLSPLALSVG